MLVALNCVNVCISCLPAASLLTCCMFGCAPVCLVQVFHWLVEDRVDYIEVTPSVSRLAHARIVSFLLALLVSNGWYACCSSCCEDYPVRCALRPPGSPLCAWQSCAHHVGPAGPAGEPCRVCLLVSMPANIDLCIGSQPFVRLANACILSCLSCWRAMAPACMAAAASIFCPASQPSGCPPLCARTTDAQQRTSCNGVRLQRLTVCFQHHP
jgi:hypothetical protein